MHDDAFVAVDTAGFATQVLERPGLSVVDFWSAACVPCRQMTRLLREIAAELPPQVVIAQVDADRNPELAERYGVRGLPTLLLFKNGALVETRTGVDRKQMLRKAIAAHA
jgi:thioredoxin 1